MMKKRKTVLIEIDEAGNSSIDLDGFEGKGCAEVVKDFRGGDTVTESRNKREFALQPARAQQKQGQGV